MALMIAMERTAVGAIKAATSDSVRPDILSVSASVSNIKK